MNPGQGSLFDPPDIPECMQLTPTDNRNTAYIREKESFPTRQLQILDCLNHIGYGNYHDIHEWVERKYGQTSESTVVGRLNDLMKLEQIKLTHDKSRKEINYYKLTQKGKERLKCNAK